MTRLSRILNRSQREGRKGEPKKLLFSVIVQYRIDRRGLTPYIRLSADLMIHLTIRWRVRWRPLWHKLQLYKQQLLRCLLHYPTEMFRRFRCLITISSSLCSDISEYPSIPATAEIVFYVSKSCVLIETERNTNPCTLIEDQSKIIGTVRFYQYPNVVGSLTL